MSKKTNKCRVHAERIVLGRLVASFQCKYSLISVYLKLSMLMYQDSFC